MGRKRKAGHFYSRLDLIFFVFKKLNPSFSRTGGKKQSFACGDAETEGREFGVYIPQ